MSLASKKYISNKIKKILKEGVRKNTMQPYNKKTNPRRPVSQSRAVAIAENMYKRRKK